MLRTVIALLLLTLPLHAAVEGGLASPWDHLKDDSFRPEVKFMNHAYGELVGSTEFLIQVEFIPYNFKNEPVDLAFPLVYDTFMPRTVRIGEIGYFGQNIPLKNVLSPYDLDLKQVAYFEVHFKIKEDDFFIKQTVLDLVVKLTPFGLVGYNSSLKKQTFSNHVSIQSAAGKKVEAQAEFTLGLSQSLLEKAKHERAKLESEVRRLRVKAKKF